MDCPRFGSPIAVGAGTSGHRLRSTCGLPSSRRVQHECRSFRRREALSREAHLRAERTRLFPVRTGFSYRKKPGRREYLRASLDRDGDEVVAIKYPRDGAGILSSIVRSDGLVIFDETASSLAMGTMVDFLPFSEVIG